MDWTAIANAEDKKGRIQTLYYLLCIRYQSDPTDAGKKLRIQSQNHQLWAQLMAEVQSELQSGGQDIGMGAAFSDTEARSFLKLVLDSYSRD